MKVLNLYAGIGGNRKLWTDVEVTAVELNEEIAGIYKDYFPDDTMIITDAHEYLLKHYKGFDFIWSSPPCQSHSRIRMMAAKQGQYLPKFPNMNLWQEITFLQNFSICKYVVENVIPYYDPYIKPTAEIERHYFWANFNFNKVKLIATGRKHATVKTTKGLYGFDLSNNNIKHRKDQILRNCVNPDLGLYILEQARGIIRSNNQTQQVLFNDHPP